MRASRSPTCEMLNVMSVARDTGALVMIHAENYDAIRFLTDRLERAGKTEPHYHATSRPIPVEREATHRAISLAELIDVPIMIVHVSNGEAMEEIRRAQQRGLKVYGETCPQYLVLTAEGHGRPQHGGREICLLAAAARRGEPGGLLGTACSRACSRCSRPTIARSATTIRKGKLTPKGRTSFRWVPNGIPGVETRLPILFSEGVGKGRISLNEFVALTATNHARTYGLYPKKGTIAVGADADIAIWDPDREVTIRQSLMHGGSDYTPYEGIKVKGWPVSTMVRGKFVVRDGTLVGTLGAGDYVPRAKSELAKPRGAADERRLTGLVRAATYRGRRDWISGTSPAMTKDRRAMTTLFSELNPPPRLLMGPGPVGVDPRVLRAMSMPMLGQFDPAFTAYMNEMMELLRQLYRTKNKWSLLVDGTARAGVEAILVSIISPGDKVLVPSFGRFGFLLAEISKRCGGEVVTIERDWGSVFTPGRDRDGDQAAQAARAGGGAWRHLDHDGAAARSNSARSAASTTCCSTPTPPPRSAA